MDPRARRRMWDVITAHTARRSIMLTTHSMEECEALCNRIGIMATGALRCLGSAQHLKNKFGTGLVVEMTCREGRVDDACTFITQTLPGSKLEEHHGNFIKFQCPRLQL